MNTFKNSKFSGILLLGIVSILML